jgi:phage-related protein
MAGPGGTEVGRVSVRVVPDTENFRDEVERELREIEKLEAEVEVTLNLEKFKAQINEVKLLLKSIQDEDVDVNIDENNSVGKFSGDLRGANESLKAFAARVKEIDDGDADKKVSRIGKALGAFGDFAQKAARTATELGSSIASTLGESMKGLVGNVASVVASMALWVPLLSALAGLIVFLAGAISAGFAGLPVLLTALAVPILTVIAGFDGIKKAAQQLGPEIDKLKKRLSDTFQKELTPVFAQLKRLFPIISDGMNEVAKATSRFVAELVKVATTPRNMENLRVALQGVSKFLDAMTPGVSKFIDSFFKIAGVEGLYTQLGQTIGGVFEQMSRFFNGQFGSGELLKSLKNVDTLIQNLVKLFFKLLEGAQKFFNSATPGMDQFFKGITSFITAIDWDRLGKIFGETFGAIGKAFDDIDSSQLAFLVDGFENIGQSIQALVDGKSFDIIIAAVRVFLDLISGAIDIINGFTEALAWIGDRALEFGDWLSNIDLSLDGAKIAEGFNTGVIMKLGELTTWFGGLKDKITGALGDSGQWLREKGRLVLDGFLAGNKMVWNNVWTFFTTTVPNAIRGAFSAAGSWLLTAGRNVIDGLRNGVTTAWNNVMTFLRNIPSIVTGVFAGAGSWLLQAGRRIIDGLISGIQSAIGRIKSVLGGITNLIPDWKGPADVDAKLLVNNGKLIMQGLITGLTAGFKPVESLLGDMTTDIGNAFGPALASDMRISGADIAAVGTSQLNVAGQVDSNLEGAVAAALSGWSIVLDETGMARLVNRGNQKLGRR